MRAKILKNMIYRGQILHAGEAHDIDDVSFYTFEKRGLLEAVNKADVKAQEIPAELPPVVPARRK